MVFTIKALSLLQPWASLISEGHKKIETRSWKTSYRGPIAIHASKNVPKWVLDIVKTEPGFADVLKGREVRQLPLGAVIAIADLVDVFCFTKDNLPGFPERYFGDYTLGRYGWVLENIKALPEPIPAKGKLNLWEWEEK